MIGTAEDHHSNPSFNTREFMHARSATASRAVRWLYLLIAFPQNFYYQTIA